MNFLLLFLFGYLNAYYMFDVILFDEQKQNNFSKKYETNRKTHRIFTFQYKIRGAV